MIIMLLLLRRVKYNCSALFPTVEQSQVKSIALYINNRQPLQKPIECAPAASSDLNLNLNLNLT